MPRTAPPRTADDQQIERALRSVAKPEHRRIRAAIRWFVYALILGFTAAAGWVGWYARIWTFEKTADRRMVFDIQNAWRQGNRVVAAARWESTGVEKPVEVFGRAVANWFVPGSAPPPPLTWGDFWKGYVSIYDQVASRPRQRQQGATYSLDYAPLRLLIVAAWVKHAREAHPQASDYDDTLAWPLLHLNTAVAAVGSIAMFALVYGWLRTCRSDAGAYIRLFPFRRNRPIFAGDWPWMAGLLAAVIFWLNPSTILDSHGFVQWDTWILPFILGAMFLSTRNWWATAGLVFGLSTGLKGQALFVLPLFLLWPIMLGRIGWAVRFAIGFTFAVLLLGLPWLIREPTAWLWVGTIAALSLCYAPQGYPKQIGLAWWLAAGVTTALAIGPYLNEQHVARIWVGLGLTAGMIVLPWLAPRGWCWPIVALVSSAAIVAAADRFDGSWNWFRVSYVAPSHQYFTLAMGPTSNLPALLASFGWEIDSKVATLGSGEWAAAVTLRDVLIGGYVITLVLCAAGAAIKHRRKDPALLIAMAAPWVAAYALLPQMHERYLVWGAALAGVTVAFSLGLSLLHWVIIALSAAGIYEQMLRVNPGADTAMLQLLQRLRPGTSWLLLLTAAIYLYAAIRPSRRAAVI